MIEVYSDCRKRIPPKRGRSVESTTPVSRLGCRKPPLHAGDGIEVVVKFVSIHYSHY